MASMVTRLRRSLDRIGPRSSNSRLAAESEAYWTRQDDQHWRSNSHFRGASAFANDPDLWERIGREHVELTKRLARAAHWWVERPRVVEWGCGGGSNAVALSSWASALVLVDLSERTVGEASAQVRRASDVPVTEVVVAVDAPERALPATGGADLFVCFYVMELVPSPSNGERILRVAAQSLRSGGLAVVQFRYADGRGGGRSRRRAYTRGLAQMTTWTIPEFWQLAETVGLRPHVLALVPRNDLDENYAYLAMTKD